MTLAPFGRRLLRVTKNERLGAYMKKLPKKP